MIVPPASEITDPTPPAPAPETPPALPTPAERVPTWPAWVKPLDAAMLLLVLVAAFMVASNVSRISDQWLYFASGRALLSGEYSLGTDPFSFATTGRAWVNHSWLFSTVAYLLYNADPTGFVVVAVKAFVFALTFGVLALIRRAGQPIWPWVLATAAAVVASAPHTGLRPLVSTGLFLALTLFLLLGRSWTRGGRANLILLGIVSWLWASCDTWFLLGPLAVALTLAGEWLQRFLGRPGATELEGESPPVRSLALALLVSVVASSLTPHHVRVWQLPVETGFYLPANHQSDFDLVLLTLSPTDKKKYIDVPSRGWNASGASFAALLLLGGVLLAAASSFGRLRVAPILLWVAFAGLALMQHRLILPFSVLAVPLIAGALTDLVERIRLGPTNSPRANLLMLMASVGRLLAFPAVVVFVLIAYPGWLHPAPVYPSLIARVAWAVEPDPGLKRTAELLNDWRVAGRLPDDYHGLIVNFDLANYVAWFAPKEKVYANGRYAFHAPELEKMVKARRTILRRGQDVSDAIEPVEIANFRELFRNDAITYVVYCGIDSVFSAVNMMPLYQLSTPTGKFALWHVDGRAVILGDVTAEQFRKDAFAALEFDPVRLAFRPDLVEQLPPAPDGARRPSGDVPFLLEYLQEAPKPPPLEALDAATWSKIGDTHFQNDLRFHIGQLAQTRDGSVQFMGWPAIAGAVGNPFLASEAQKGGYSPSDVSVAYNLLAFRAAWRAIAANPDHPEPYLYVALTTDASRPTLPGLSNEIRQNLQIAGFRQFLDRAPPPETINPRAASQVGRVAWQLSMLFQPDPSPGGIQYLYPEAAEQTLRLARKYFERSLQTNEAPKEAAEAQLKEMDARASRLKEMIIPANNDYEKFKNEPPDVQVRKAVERRLLLRAMDKFTEAWDKENLGPQPLQLVLQAVEIDIALGRADEADLYLHEFERQIEDLRSKGTAVPENLVDAALQMRMLLWQLRGDYGKFGDAVEKIVRLPPLTPAEKQALQAAVQRPTLEEFDQLTHPPVVMGALGGLGWRGEGKRQPTPVENGLAKWLSASKFFTQRGVSLVFEGRISGQSGAKGRLEQSLRPEGIEVPKYHPQRALAEQYLRMIDHAMK